MPATRPLKVSTDAFAFVSRVLKMFLTDPFRSCRLRFGSQTPCLSVAVFFWFIPFWTLNIAEQDNPTKMSPASLVKKKA